MSWLEFDQHLDQCQQCEQHPFEMCPIGDVLLSELVEVALKELWAA